MGLRELLIPQDKIFFDLFEKQAGIVKEAAWQLVALTEDFTNVKEKRHAIWLLESKGDQVTHEIYDQLNRTFITPLDPEEISRLASIHGRRAGLYRRGNREDVLLRDRILRLCT